MEFITPCVVAKVRDTVLFVDTVGGVLYNFWTLSYHHWLFFFLLFFNYFTCRCITFLSFLCYYRLDGELFDYVLETCSCTFISVEDIGMYRFSVYVSRYCTSLVLFTLT